MATNITMAFLGPTSQHHPPFFEGREAGLGQKAIPCSQDFLDDIVHKLTRFYLQSMAKKAKVNLMNNLNINEVTIAQLNHAISECVRLELHPELFPTKASRDNFVPIVIKLARDIAASQLVNGNPTLGHAPVLPHFHPLNLATGLAWNKWLNNSVIGRPGWVAIQQRIPGIGLNILKKIGAQYDREQQKFSQMGGHLSVDANDKLPAYDEPFKHMTWSGFFNGVEDLGFFTHGFRTQGRHKIDFDGSLVLEMYSKLSIHMARRRAYRPRVVDVIPYFRWAMGYQAV